NVTKRFRSGHGNHDVVAVDGLSLSIHGPAPGEAGKSGEFVVLLGPSGCGKSTILGLIAGLALPESGEVRGFGERVRGPHGRSATVPQAYTCFPWLSVLGNVEFGLRLHGVPLEERHRVAVEYLKKVRLADFGDSSPKRLSGGMQQRVAIARTLALKRPI